MWADEFFYVLFDHINSLEDNEKDLSKKKKLVRSLSKISESIDDKMYYDKMRLASFGDSFFEEASGP